MSVLRLVVTGKSVQELRSECVKFLSQTGDDKGTTAVDDGQMELKERDLDHTFESFKPCPVNVADAITHVASTLTPVALPVDKPVETGAYPPNLPQPKPKLSSRQTEEEKVLEFGTDSRGFPWDARIHAVSEGKNKNGTWRYRRGVEDKYIDEVEFDLKAKAEQPAAHPTSLPEPHAVKPPGPVSYIAPPTPVAPPVVAVPPLPPPVPVVTLMHSLETFKGQMPLVLVKLVEEGKLTKDWVQSVKNYCQVEELWKLNDTQKTELFNNLVEAGMLQRIQ